MLSVVMDLSPTVENAVDGQAAAKRQRLATKIIKARG
jgi:hypothetical protein